jgi:hypothetical protein
LPSRGRRGEDAAMRMLLVVSLTCALWPVASRVLG